MTSFLAYCFATSTVVLTFNIISPVEGQCTVQGCETDDSSNNIVAQMREINSQLDTIMTRLEAVDRRSQEQDALLQQIKTQKNTVLARIQEVDQRSHEQVQSIREFLNASFQEKQNEQDSSKKRLEAIDRRSQEQVQSIHEFLNASIQEIKTEQDSSKKRLEAVDRRSQEQVQSIREFLNASFQEIKTEQDSSKKRLEAVDRRSQEQEAYTKQVLNASLQQFNTVMARLQAIDRRTQEKYLSVHDFLNASFQQMKDDQDRVKTNLPEKLERVYEVLNASFQRIENRQDIVVTSLENVDQSIKNQTQISWRLATAFRVDDWIVIMHRFDGSVNFSRNWVEYRNGFGDKERGEFWLGNEEVHRLTNRFSCNLRVQVQLKSSGEWYYAEYSSFSLDSEGNKYRLRLSGYSGNAGDALTNSTDLSTSFYHGGMNFSTWDNDNDKGTSIYNCAQSFSCGWWFNDCFRACLTCHQRGGFYWSWLGGWQTTDLLRAARMMIRSS